MCSMYKGDTKIMGSIQNIPLTQTIDANSTAKDIPSGKSIYTSCIENQIKDYYVGLRTNTDMSAFGIDDISTLTSLLDLTKKLGYNKRFTIQVNFAIKTTLYNCNIIPVDKAGLLTITFQQGRGEAIYISYDNTIYISNTEDSTKIDWTAWKRVCTTKVADVNRTVITNPSNITSGTISYTIRNGICSVEISGITPDGINSTTIPLPKSLCYTVGLLVDATGTPVSSAFGGTNGTFSISNITGTTALYGGFSYLVAES